MLIDVFETGGLMPLDTEGLRLGVVFSTSHFTKRPVTTCLSHKLTTSDIATSEYGAQFDGLFTYCTLDLI